MALRKRQGKVGAQETVPDEKLTSGWTEFHPSAEGGEELLGENPAVLWGPGAGLVPHPPVTARVMTCFASLAVHLTPVSTAKNGVSSKSRKRVMPEPVTEPPVTDPIYEALLYCNIPSVAERSMEGRPSCAAQCGTWTRTPLRTSSSSSSTA